MVSQWVVEDLTSDLTIRYKLVNSNLFGFEVFQVYGISQGEKVYLSEEDERGLTTELDLAERFIFGTIKWDGSSDIRIIPFIHFSYRQETYQLADALNCAYAIASEQLKGYIGA